MFMKFTPATGLLLGFITIFIIAAVIASIHPVQLGPMDESTLENNPMPLIMPKSDSGLPVLSDSMPEFAGITKWLNTPDGKPLTKEDLKGKVVLVDFWTYSCINCIRTQPVLRAWWDAYKDDGFVIVGVHTPEFAFEKVEKNVAEAVQKAKLEYPIALDPDYQTWQAYSNHYWPAGYFFDRQGRLRFMHAGEGEYDKQEDVIRTLLAESGETLEHAPTGADTAPHLLASQTPETYFGARRGSHFANQNEFGQVDASTTFTLRDLRKDEWSIDGTWSITEEYALAEQSGDRFTMNVQANAMHIVLGSADGPKRLRVLVDGKNPTDEQLTADTVRQEDGSAVITVEFKDLYRIAKFPDSGRHTVELQLLDPGVEFYAATFGE